MAVSAPLRLADKAPYSVGFAQRVASLNARPRLDVQVCDHCNLRCAGCMHFAPLAPERYLDLGEYERDLRCLAAVEGISGFFEAVVLMGGEPLLHPSIAKIVRLTRCVLPEERIQLGTNGLLLGSMGDAFWDAVVDCDVEIVISAYPIRVDYAALFALVSGHGIRASYAGDFTRTGRGKDAFVRLALDPEGRCDPVSSFVGCPLGGCTMQIARGALWPCQVAAHHGFFTRRFGYAMHDDEGDSLSLASIASADDIENFRRSPHPMCRHCDSGRLSVAPWKRSAFAADEWLA